MSLRSANSIQRFLEKHPLPKSKIKEIIPISMPTPMPDKKNLPQKNLKNPKGKSFIKYSTFIQQTLGSGTAAKLFAELEYRFNIMPDGFYKFTSPCNHPAYRKGDSWKECLNMSHSSFFRASKLLIKHYASKTKYKSASESEDDVFDGMPYLSYWDAVLKQTFYFRNEEVVKSLLAGTKPVNKSVDNPVDNAIPISVKMTALEIGQNDRSKSVKMTDRDSSESGSMTSSQDESSVPKNTTKNTLSLNLSQKDGAISEQEKEEQPLDRKIKIQDGLEQPPEVSAIIGQMVDVWRKTTGFDLNYAPRKEVVEKLEAAFAHLGSLEKWLEYCNTLASSKYLMGETESKYKLNLAWACKLESIKQIADGKFTLGDRNNVIFLELQPFTDTDPVVLSFKNACLHSLGKGFVISWLNTMKITRLQSGELKCHASTKFIASYVVQSYTQGIGHTLRGMNIPAVLICLPSGEIVGRIKPV